MGAADELEQLAALGPGLAKILKGNAGADEILAFAEGLSKWLCGADPALAPQLEVALGWIAAWRAMGAAGMPAPTWQPGPGTYRGR